MFPHLPWRTSKQNIKNLLVFTSKSKQKYEIKPGVPSRQSFSGTICGQPEAAMPPSAPIGLSTPGLFRI
jgi:hypothetical protein